MARRGVTVVALVALLVATLLVAGCAGPSAAAVQKAQCFANESLIQSYMKLFNEDSGIYPPLQDVIDKLHVKCPSGGTYSFDATTGVVTCSVHGHP
jgi:hypothetical protein